MYVSQEPTLDEIKGMKSFLLTSRDWESVKTFLCQCILDPAALPDYLNGEGEYGLTDLVAMRYHPVEYAPKDKRKTFALRIGYLGWKYSGFQKQVAEVYTVQDDLLGIIGKPVVAAGRTDAQVSALSQVVSYHTFDDITEHSIQERFSSFVEASGNMHLRLLSCVRVSRQFHALFCATWRRYIYLLPLNPKSTPSTSSETRGCPHGEYDIDVDFISKTFSRLESKNLNYQAFQVKGEIEKDDPSRGYCCLL